MRGKLPVTLVALLASTALVACGDDTSDEGANTPQPTAPAGQPSDGPTDVGPDGQAPSTGKSYDGGSVQTETITVGEMEIEAPKGLRLPQETLITQSDEANISMADADPAPIIAAIKESAEASGYELYAEREASWLYVGNGNAVVLLAIPDAQMLTWGPEEMKDELRDAVMQGPP